MDTPGKIPHPGQGAGTSPCCPYRNRYMLRIQTHTQPCIGRRSEGGTGVPLFRKHRKIRKLYGVQHNRPVDTGDVSASNFRRCSETRLFCHTRRRPLYFRFVFRTGEFYGKTRTEEETKEDEVPQVRQEDEIRSVLRCRGDRTRFRVLRRTVSLRMSQMHVRSRILQDQDGHRRLISLSATPRFGLYTRR